MQSTPIAVLGTLTEFHREPIPYDMLALVQLVADLDPDLLCLDIAPDKWEQQDFSDLPPEYQEALLPLAHQTDMVVVPIGSDRPVPEPTAGGWRGSVIKRMRGLLAYLQRTAPGPQSINQGPRHTIANILYQVIGWLAGDDVRRALSGHTNELTRAVLAVAERDPGSRVLVVVNVQHCHHIRHKLEHQPQIQSVRYSQL
jgi:hypothetical protein